MKKNLIFLFILLMLFTLNHWAQNFNVGLNFNQFYQETYKQQKLSQWCWVACVSMVFEHYGHPISQKRLVTSVYGAPVNLPAGIGLNMTNLVNRTWTDDNGKQFRAEVIGLYDATTQMSFRIDNKLIKKELSNEHPLIIAVGTHAVVMIGVRGYYNNYNFPVVTSAKVADPWPGRGIYSISGIQIVPRYRGGQLIYVCSIRVTDLD